MKIFITGGTGFIGKRLVQKIADQVDTIFILVRPTSLKKAKNLFENYNNVKIVLGDILDNRVLINKEDETQLIHEVDSIVHLAGYYDLKINQLNAYTHNVIGFQNVINLTLKFKNLKYFHHVSTYAVTGNLKGIHSENTIANPRNFTDHYSRSKMQGETIFRNVQMPNVKKRIYRPGIVVGSTQDGEIEKIDGPYYLLKFINQYKDSLKIINSIKYLPFPFDEKTILPLIPVDILTHWLIEAVLNPSSHEELRSYHFVSNNKIFIKDVIELIFNLNEIKPKIIKIGKIPYFDNILPMMGIPKQLMTYMFQGADFDTKNRQEDFPKLLDFHLNDIAKNFVTGASRFFQRQTI
jgi:thioester reductase-like protein